MQSQEKRVIKNGLYNYILTFFSTVVPVFTIPYVTRVLGAEGYGEFSIAFNLVNYFQVLTEYGFGLYGARKVAVAESDEEINLCFSKIFISRFCLCTISFLFLIIYLFIFVENARVVYCVFILFMMVLGSMFQQNWLLQGLEKMKYITGIGVLSRFISLILIFWLVKTPADVFKYCFFYALTNFLIGIVGFVFVIKKLRIKFLRVSIDSILKELKLAKDTFLSILGAKIITSIGITVLGLVDSEESVGIYNAIYKVPNVVIMMFTPISQAIYPYISRKYMQSYSKGLNCVFKIVVPVMALFISMSTAIFLFSEQIVSMVFGMEYISKHILLKIFMPWLIFSILNNFFGIQILVASGHSNFYSNAFAISVMVSIMLNIFLVGEVQAVGAALSVLISEVILSSILIFYVFKIFYEEYSMNDKKCEKVNKS